MRRELLMPKLGLTMTEGTLVEWLVAPGESFKAEQIIFVVESEKAAVEIPAEADGTLLEALAAPGQTLPVGMALGLWNMTGEEAGPSTVGGVPMPAAEPVPEPLPQPASQSTEGAVPGPRVSPGDSSPLSRIPVTPLARRVAAQRGIDLSLVQGSGPRGRIRVRDLEQVPEHVAVTQAIQPRSTPAGELRQPSALEQTMARRLTAAKQEIPHFYLSVEAEVSRLQELRRELNAAQDGQRFTLNHFILAAVARALAETPRVNRVWTADGILDLASTDVGMAVNTERGLLVPVLRGLGDQPLGQIARAASSGLERAQGGRLTAEEMIGGAITVSNAGMFDVTYMSSIINPGQAMILGVGSVRELFRPDAQGQPALRREIGLVLSADHRVLDGVSALQFLKRVVHHLEQPLGVVVA